ncbi:hypothetical protein ABI59_10290 [Acidobacteria bacterium Mor1]|nr:hypothetical protein ABI59_10290 [Acidobacteria bacterium Mor1]
MGAFCAGFAQAQQGDGTPPCSGEKYRLFDFWVGDWDVFDTEGTSVGRNRIESILGGCAIQENWTGGGGSIGHSFNIYDAANDKWHQTWVDNRGLLLELDGGFRDGKMVLEGKRPGPDGKLVHHRITWQATGEGHVKQRWETTTDGSNWNAIFEGVYKKRS